jgi:hypothetical protein
MNTIMDKFWELLQESVIVQGVLTVMIVGAWLYMVIAGKQPPAALESLVTLVVGFFFGQKLSMVKAQGARSIKEADNG